LKLSFSGIDALKMEVECRALLQFLISPWQPYNAFRIKAPAMNKSGKNFAEFLHAFPKLSMLQVSAIFISLLLFLHYSQLLAYGLSWFSLPPEENARNCNLIVVGKLMNIDHDLAKYKGDRYSKRMGLIRVDKVLLKPEGEKIPDTVRVYWGMNVLFEGQQIMEFHKSRFLAGAWLLSRNEESDDFYLVGVEDEVFVSETESDDFSRSLSEVTPLLASIHIREESHILNVRHFNFGDKPRQALSWRLDKSKLLVPPPFQLVMYGYDSTNPEERPIMGQSDSLDVLMAENIKIDPHTYVDQKLDVSAWVSEAGGIKDAEPFRLKIDGKRDEWIPLVRPPEESVKDDMLYRLFLNGDWGGSVWWFPSTAKMRWLLLAFGPLLTIAMFTFRYQGRYRLCALSLGAFLGIIWAWLFVAFGLKTIIALSLAMRGEISPKHIIIMLSMVAVLFIVSVRAVRRVNCYEPHRNRTIKAGWFAILPWLAFPAVVVALAIAGERSFVLY
jgi:hypothetical protein